MSAPYDKYEIVIGLEVHAQLLTASKLFCGDSAEYGGGPNTHISAITLGHPGTLPKMNRQAIDFAIKMGLACHCEISRYNYFARKNYFYPDLPKGYQLSQHTTPICKGGYVAIKTTEGNRNIRLNRIHLEEDAGKSLHDIDPENTCVDYNRAGVPLIEIVTEPDMHSGDEAYAYLTELRKLLRYLEICDGNMEEGSMRCDANISIRLKGETRLGTKVEVKNLNSIRNVKKAIEVEAKRMVDEVESGGSIIQQTRSFDAANNTTFMLRTKEDADDYRYFADPDLPPFRVTEEMLEKVRASIPALPEERIAKYTTQLQLPEYDARVITDEKEMAEFFEQIIQHTGNYKAAANWILGPIKSWLNENNQRIGALPLSPKAIASVIALIDSGQINFSVASTRLFAALLNDANAEPAALARQLNLVQDSNENNVAAWIEEVLNRMPEKVEEYKKGKKGLIGLFVGEVKKVSKGKADPKLTNDILLKKLQQ
jgi:aspartyl-tRNA(Asn)/glutamyl-tRNA(Gln) amidotransferase subunit B